MNGTADAFGSYASEVMVEFGYFDNHTGVFVLVDFFDTPLSGGPSTTQDDPIASTTLAV